MSTGNRAEPFSTVFYFLKGWGREKAPTTSRFTLKVGMAQPKIENADFWWKRNPASNQKNMFAGTTSSAFKVGCGFSREKLQYQSLHFWGAKKPSTFHPNQIYIPTNTHKSFSVRVHVPPNAHTHTHTHGLFLLPGSRAAVDVGGSCLAKIINPPQHTHLPSCRIEISVLGTFRGEFEGDFGPFLGRFGVTSGSFWHRFGLFWYRFDLILTPFLPFLVFLRVFGNVLGSWLRGV